VQDLLSFDLIRASPPDFEEVDRLIGVPPQRLPDYWRDIQTSSPADSPYFLWFKSLSILSIVDSRDFSARAIPNFWKTPTPSTPLLATSNFPASPSPPQLLGISLPGRLHFFSAPTVTLLPFPEGSSSEPCSALISVRSPWLVYLGTKSHFFTYYWCRGPLHCYSWPAAVIRVVGPPDNVAVAGDGVVRLVNSSAVDGHLTLLAVWTVPSTLCDLAARKYPTALIAVRGVQEGWVLKLQGSNVSEERKGRESREEVKLTGLIAAKSKFHQLYDNFNIRQILIPHSRLLRIQVSRDCKRIYCGGDSLRILQQDNEKYKLLGIGAQVKSFLEIRLLKQEELLVVDRQTSSLIKYNPSLTPISKIDGKHPIDTGNLVNNSR